MNFKWSHSHLFVFTVYSFSLMENIFKCASICIIQAVFIYLSVCLNIKQSDYLVLFYKVIFRTMPNSTSKEMLVDNFRIVYLRALFWHVDKKNFWFFLKQFQCSMIAINIIYIHKCLWFSNYKFLLFIKVIIIRVFLNVKLRRFFLVQVTPSNTQSEKYITIFGYFSHDLETKDK